METTTVSVPDLKSTFADVCRKLAPFYKIDPNGPTELKRALRGSLSASEVLLKEQVKTVLIALVSHEPWAEPFKHDPGSGRSCRKSPPVRSCPCMPAVCRRKGRECRRYRSG
jgi:hypothetical protein